MELCTSILYCSSLIHTGLNTCTRHNHDTYRISLRSEVFFQVGRNQRILPVLAFFVLEISYVPSGLTDPGIDWGCENRF